MRNKKYALETLAAQAMGEECSVTGAVIPPIHISTTFARDQDYQFLDKREYIRSENPSFDLPEKLLTELEGGAASMLFSSGLAACQACFQVLKQGDHVVVQLGVYHGMRFFMEEFLARRGVAVSFFNSGDMGEFKQMIRPKETKIAWIETPSNPYLALTDIAKVADICRANDIYLAIDSTVATPVHTQALKLGAHLVCHSATKYLNGHSDVLAGMICCAEEDDMWQDIKRYRHLTGPLLGSFESYLLQRGMRTLFLRVRKQSENALALAQHLDNHSWVDRVYYPGLPNHQGHDIALRQMQGGFGGLLSFEVNGDGSEALEVAKRFQVFKRATSLGGVESLAEHRRSIEGPKTGVSPKLIRVSVGIEDIDDLIWDMDQSLAQVFKNK